MRDFFDLRRHVTCAIMGRVQPCDVQHHVPRRIGGKGARNAKVTETACEGLECVYDAGAFVCVGWVQRVSVLAEQPRPAVNAVVNYNWGNRGNTRA